jgi:hypothetical protein
MKNDRMDSTKIPISADAREIARPMARRIINIQAPMHNPRMRISFAFLRQKQV